MGIFSWILLARFWLQWARADFYNPISQGIVKMTDPVLKPIRKILPSNRRYDFASILLLLLLPLVVYSLISLLSGGGLPELPLLFVLVVKKTLFLVLSMLLYVVIIRSIASWIAPSGYNPAINLLIQLTEPFLIPLRRIIPPSGGLDWAPMILMIILWFLQNIVTRGAF